MGTHAQAADDVLTALTSAPATYLPEGRRHVLCGALPCTTVPLTVPDVTDCTGDGHTLLYGMAYTAWHGDGLLHLGCCTLTVIAASCKAGLFDRSILPLFQSVGCVWSGFRWCGCGCLACTQSIYPRSVQSSACGGRAAALLVGRRILYCSHLVIEASLALQRRRNTVNLAQRLLAQALQYE